MSAGTPHIPAWKRLGLKLKFAKDEAPTPERTGPIAAPVETNGHKRRKLSPPINSETNGYSEVEAPTKAPELLQVTPKPEKAEKAEKKKKKKSATSTSVKEVAVGSETPRVESEKTSKKRRKSVSFTPDTKSADGTSSKDLYDQWTKDEGGVDTGSGPLPDALKVVDGTKSADSDTAEKPAKRKKVKKSKSTNLLAKGAIKPTSDATTASANSHPQSTSTNKSPLVEYLDTYHTDRDSWKFNKARQNQIFKHIFDLDKIPSSADDALIEYIKGLNSEPVRARLRQQANEIRQKDIQDGLGGDDEDMASHYGIDTTTSNPDGPRNKPNKVSTDGEREYAAYLFAVRRYKKIRTHLAIEREEEVYQLESPEWQERLARRIRSEQMLKALGESVVASALNPVREKEGVDSHVERNVSTRVVTANGTTENKKKRKRKRRTAVEDDDSSSDESSSDEEAETQHIEAQVRAVLPDGSATQAGEKASKVGELEALRAAERKQLLAILKKKKVPQKDIDDNIDKFVDVSLKKRGIQIDSSDDEASDENSESEDEDKSKSKRRRTGDDSSSGSGESTSSEESGTENSSEDGQSDSSDDSD